MDWGGSASFGSELRRLRVSAGLTQRALAERAGVSVRAVRYIETGQVEQPRRESVLRLAEAVGLTVPERPSVEQLSIAVLGHLEVRRGGQVVDIGPLKQRCLLAVLALQPNQVVSLHEIIDVLWGGTPPDSCHNLVHTYVSRLRKVLEPDPLPLVSAPHGGYLLAATSDQLDLMRFDELTENARRVLAGDPPAGVRTLAEALDCWRGPLLADLPVLRHYPAALSAGARRISASLEYADTSLELGLGPEHVVELLRALSWEEPLHEALHARLMLALTQAGQQAEALRLFTDLRTRLDEELGIEPGEAICAAHLKILRHDPQAAVAGTADRLPVPAQLPADVSGFAGRAEYLAQLDDLAHDDNDAAVVISAIAGTAGVGKTALAVHWAHRVRRRFPDGQLYLNLRGYAPGAPMRPVEALTRFLHALGVPADRVPLDEDEAAGLYRTQLADRSVLIVLDNAESADQVRPLLPGSPGCLVLVTSRDRLAGLVANEGAHRITLDVLDPDDARVLLTGMIGKERTLAELDAVDELAAACAYLPLALRIAAANLVSTPYNGIAAYTAELRHLGRLTALTINGDERGVVQAAFDLSHGRLDPASRRLFRLLGLVPGPDFTPNAAAALIDGTVPEGKGLLDKLAGAHLVQQHVLGRYQFHDLLREYAGTLAQQDDHQAATERLLDFYLCTADRATRLLYPHILRLPVPPAISSHAVAFGTENAAIHWLDAERPNLVAAAIHTPDHGIASYAWRLTDALRGYFLSRGHGSDGLAVCTAGLTAAKYDGNEAGEGCAYDVLGLIHYNLGDFRQAMLCHDKALVLNRRSGTTEAEASSLHNLGRAYSNAGRPARAARLHEQALEINRGIGNRHGEAQALNYIGTAALSLGQIDRAMTHHRAALDLARHIYDRDVEARALHGLGLDCSATGDLRRSIMFYTDCLALAHEIGNLPGAAITLVTLAEANSDAGRHDEAEVGARHAIAQGRLMGDRRTEVRGLDVLATVCRRLGDHSAADGHYRAALHVAREIGYFYGEASVLLGLAACLRVSDRAREAVSSCREAVYLVEESGIRLFEATALTELAHAYFELGELDAAAVHGGDALRIARERTQRLVEARALRVMGLHSQTVGDPKAAAGHWRLALEIFTDVGTTEAREIQSLLDGQRRART